CLDCVSLARDSNADVVLLEVEDEPHQISVELDQLAGHHAGKAVDAGDAVSGGEHGARLVDLDLLAVRLDLLAEDAADLVCSDLHGGALRVAVLMGEGRPSALCGAAPAASSSFRPRPWGRPAPRRRRGSTGRFAPRAPAPCGSRPRAP